MGNSSSPRNVHMSLSYRGEEHLGHWPSNNSAYFVHCYPVVGYSGYRQYVPSAEHLQLSNVPSL